MGPRAVWFTLNHAEREKIKAPTKTGLTAYDI